MADGRVELFCEDGGHELFARSLLSRIGREQGMELRIETRSARGGHGRLLDELSVYQRTLESRYSRWPLPDLLVVVIDANRIGSTERERQVKERIVTKVFPRVVVGCPDPYVERWCFADPEAFARVVGVTPPDSKASRRDECKDLLKRAILEGGHTIATDPMEFAPDIVEAMDLYRAGKQQSSLRSFVDGIKAHLVQMSSR
jgi:hypothetical protein